ncbi:MAG TPA: helix-turn-helix transcriptional regulator [Bradyrhizobium sp.]
MIRREPPQGLQAPIAPAGEVPYVTGMAEQTPTLLEIAGLALFGPQWQSELARQLDVNDRTLRRWFAGTVEPSPGVWQDIRKLLERKQVACAKALEKVRARCA